MRREDDPAASCRRRPTPFHARKRDTLLGQRLSNCGVESTFDSGDDGLNDATSRVTCENGRIRTVRDRDMLSEGFESQYFATKLGAPAQGSASADVEYDADPGVAGGG